MALDGYGHNSSLLAHLRLRPWQGLDLASAHPSSAAPLVPRQGQGQQGTLPQAQALGLAAQMPCRWVRPN